MEAFAPCHFVGCRPLVASRTTPAARRQDRKGCAGRQPRNKTEYAPPPGWRASQAVPRATGCGRGAAWTAKMAVKAWKIHCFPYPNWERFRTPEFHLYFKTLRTAPAAPCGLPGYLIRKDGAFAVYVVKPLHLPRRRTPQTVRSLSFKPKAVGDFKGVGSGRRSPAARSRPGAGPDAAAGGLLRGLQEPAARRAPGAAAGWPAVVVLGYGDLNDHDKLRDDSLLALADDDLTGENRERNQGHPLARTLNRPAASAQRPESPSRACPKAPAARRSGRIKRTSRNSSSR